MADVKLADRVMVQQLTKTPDAGGGQARNWSDFREVWAKVDWGFVSRDSQNAEIGRRRKASVTMRFAPDLPDPMRLMVDQKALVVLARARISDGASAFLQLECEDTF